MGENGVHGAERGFVGQNDVLWILLSTCQPRYLAGWRPIPDLYSIRTPTVFSFVKGTACGRCAYGRDWRGILPVHGNAEFYAVWSETTQSSQKQHSLSIFDELF